MILALCALVCQCAIPYREPVFDAGYGMATAVVARDSIRVSIPVGEESLMPEGPYRVVCTLKVQIGSHLSTILVSTLWDDEGYVPLVWRRYVRKNTAIFRNVDYQRYDDVRAYYDGALHITLGPEWAGQALEHRPDRIYISLGESHGAIPIQYGSDGVGETRDDK